MLCSARCSCFLCRELQSCRAADARKPPNKQNMSDNFILKKAEAWEPMKFIRGAARLSVRHWQSREPLAPGKPRSPTHKSTSCEQLYPQPSEEGSYALRKAPSSDRMKQSDNKPLFKLLGNSRSKKISDNPDPNVRRSVLNFRKNEQKNSKNVHEKYVPLQKNSTSLEHIYSEPKLWNSKLDECCRPPIYQSVEKKVADNKGADKKILNNRPPCYDELAKKLSDERNKKVPENGLANKITQSNNKVVIYFGDSLIRKHNEEKKEEKAQEQKEEAIYANRVMDEKDQSGIGREVDKGGGTQLISEVQVTEAIYSEIKNEPAPGPIPINDATYKKDVKETMSSDGFLIVEFEGNFERARQLVELVHGGGSGMEQHEATMLDDDEQCDWSFIQNWRKRPSSGCRPEEAWCSAGVSGARALRVRVAGAAPAHARRLSPPPHAHRATTPPPPPPIDPPAKPNPEDSRTEAPEAPSGAQLKAISAVSPVTAASTPVKSAPALSSYALERRKHDRPADTPQQNGVRECNSSSDENRSSGHASMSDSGGGGEAGRDEPRRSRQPPHPRTKHRPHNKLQSPWPGGGGLEDIRSAIKQLTLRSRDSSSTATSGASSGGGGSNNAQETGSAAEARRRRAPLVRQPSLDTVCTNVTSADEFVWVDSHNRLVELRCVPWTAGEVSRALQTGRCREAAARLAPDAPPRLAYLLQRALVRIAREAQRLSQNFGFCSKHEVAGAFRIILSTPLADSCIKGCQRAATMYATSGSAARRLGSAARARTSLAPGRFLRWMLDVRVASFVHEYAAIYLCAGMETLLEEIALIAGSGAAAAPITPATIDHAVANCADLWGLLQPYSHLNAGRVASGALSLSRWESMSSLGSGTGSSSGAPRPENRQLGMSHDSGITTNGSAGSGTSGSNTSTSESAGTNGSAGSGASVLLTTCAGSAGELRAVLRQLSPRHPPLSPAGERALYYFMRCSQLEHSTSGASAGAGACGGAGGLWGERGAGALPPLGEWVRVARAHAALRPPPVVPDADDVLQAARLLLPHADCPPRPVTMEEAIEPAWSRCTRTVDEVSRAALGLAQRALLSGRAEFLSGVRALLPPAGIDATDGSGLTALMKAALAGDEQVVAMLLEAGADPNIETGGLAAQHSALLSPSRSPNHPHSSHLGNTPANAYTPPTAGWTALVYACSGAGAGGSGAVEAARRLLAAGARVDGAPARGEDVCTLTPLQVACGVGNLELVQLLLSHGADPFLSTQLTDALCYSAAAQYGCYSAVAVCCTHGRRACLRAAVRGGGGRAVLSLEEVLAEGAPPAAGRPPPFTKQQQRALQDAMYCAAETDHLDITLELRALGVPWSLHAWTLSLAAAAEASLDHVIDQLLQDFLQVCPSDDSHYGKQFIYECLPLLFNILRYSKKEGTVLLLADILCACYGWEAVPGVREPPPATAAPARVDVSYVNNPSLADVTFRVEGRLFYGHKIVLVSESPRLRSMLAPARNSAEALPPANTTPPLVQINDIRYHIFEQVMKYLYSGGCSNLDIPESDVLEVLAAASFFQLLPLQRHCEARAAKSVDLHNLVSVYIHAKVYGATQLLEYCQGFLLQNMVALLTYDDSVKRLLFGKRLPGHNVLGALLVTLQKRIESRKNQAKVR